MDHYATLGLDPHASQRDIKRAYRRLAFRYHPDLHPGVPDAEDRFKEVVSAYTVLSNRVARAEYDERRSPTPRASTPTPRGSGGPERRERERTAHPEWDALFEKHRARGARWDLPLRFGDLVGGALVAACVTFSVNSSLDPHAFLAVLSASLVCGFTCSWPLGRLARNLRHVTLRRVVATLTLVLALGGAFSGAALAGVRFPSPGVVYAVSGGGLGGAFGAAFGRIFASVLGRASGVVSGAIVGGVIGAGLAGFLWYWGTVFDWVRAPIDEPYSMAAARGILGALMGAALAGAFGSLALRRS